MAVGALRRRKACEQMLQQRFQATFNRKSHKRDQGLVTVPITNAHMVKTKKISTLQLDLCCIIARSQILQVPLPLLL